MTTKLPSLTSRQESLQRANASADIFSQGAPGKPIHPWISERQRFGQTAVADAEARQARVGEMERGERPPAKKSAWRSLIENSTSGVVSGATKVTMVAEAIGEVGQTSMEAAGYRPEDAEQSKVLPGVVVELGELIADKVTALFPGDPARRDEATQILAKRAAQMLATVGGASAASAWRDITGAQSDRRRLWWRTNECLPTMGTHEHIYVL